ncbi:MAG: helix-turn-helix domain-containing protein [Barnesiella sp.]|nr:helix-turn-helix domain-containing protein [Barnesiella sp.]
MYRRHNFEERLKVISRILSGESIESVCRVLSLDRKNVRQWLLRYKKYGEDGLHGTRSYHYSTGEKLKIVEEFTVKGVPLQELCLRYDLSRSTIQKWARTAQQGISLNNKRRGRPPKEMSRPKKREPQTELEKLQAENLRLRAENALLKKVKALVEEQEARARLNEQKPSMN